MCGRFQLDFMPDAEDLFEELFGFRIQPPEVPLLFGDDILPFREISAIHRTPNKELVARPMFWNLVPRSSPQFDSGRTWFNLRREKLSEPLQSTLLAQKRCLIPVTSFYENRKVDGQPVYRTEVVNRRRVRKKESYRFAHAGQPLMLLGGIYDIWTRDGRGQQYSCTIITLPPNDMIGEVHDRMPFILPNEAIQTWLDPACQDPWVLMALVQPYPSEQMSRSQIWPPPQQTLPLFG